MLRDTTQLAVMTHSYHAPLVILSVIVAIFASFAALELAGRVRSESGAPRIGWLAGGGAVMGLGIWSMHFVGMLAFQLPVPIGYDLLLMLVSVVVAIAASFLALIVIGRPELGPSTLVPAGLLMGGAIAGMHYIGMASMRMEARESYSVPIVALSVLIAIVAFSDEECFTARRRFFRNPSHRSSSRERCAEYWIAHE